MVVRVGMRIRGLGRDCIESAHIEAIGADWIVARCDQGKAHFQDYDTPGELEEDVSRMVASWIENDLHDKSEAAGWTHA